MLLRNIKESTLSMIQLKKIGILFLAVLLLTPGVFSIFMFPGAVVQGDDMPNNQPRNSSPRSSRTIVYDMNLSHDERHQLMTIQGWRGININEFPPETQLIECMEMGDIDGDGYDDLIISSEEENYGPRIDCGVVYIIYGTNQLPVNYDMAAHINLTILGANGDDGLGSSLVIADINNDTYNDIIVGAERIDTVYVFYGGPYIKSMSPPWDLSSVVANLTITGNNQDAFGTSLAAGDLNNDGIDDLIIGAPMGDGFADSKNDCGEIYVLQGEDNLTTINLIDFSQPSPPTNVNTSIVYGVDPNDQFGTLVESNGDFNGDGYMDIAVSAPYSMGYDNTIGNDVGEVNILYWSYNMTQSWDLSIFDTRANFTVYGNRTLDNFGLSSMVLSDVNGDYAPDLIVGIPYTEESFSIPDAGLVDVFFGSGGYTPEPYRWNLNTWQFTPANLTIVYPIANVNAGMWVDSFDWNYDNINDIIFTAPGVDGNEINQFEIGELVVVNGTQFPPSRIIIGQSAPAYRILGAELNDRLGGIVTSGDLDGDNYLDLAVFAQGADGLNNGRLDCGEIYIIPGSATLAPYVTTLRLRNGDGFTNKTCYAKYDEYEFELNVTTPLGPGDLTNLSIILDPSGLNLKYTWLNPDQWMEIRDPGEFAMITSTPLNATPGGYNWWLSFNIEFNWSCPYSETPLPIYVELYNSFGYHITRFFQNIFMVESRLNFSGELQVLEEDTKLLNDNDWVRGGRNIRWTNLTVIYENASGIYPLTGEYEVNLWNATDSWVITSLPGTAIDQVTQTSTSSKAIDSYKINITGIPAENDMSNITFNLRIDAEKIGFSNPGPSSDVWQTTVPVTCTITATDLGGNFVDASTMQFRTSNNDGISWSNWTNAGLTTDSANIIIVKNLMFPDSPANLIQWRGNDTIGNGYETSEQYSIMVDTKNVSFKNAKPATDDIQNSLEVKFSISISDNTSGVNASTIEYSYSFNEGVGWSDWINLGLEGIYDNINVNATMNFTLGNKNRIKWHATDAAGNGPQESEVQIIDVFIATTELKAYLIRPINNAEVGNATPKLVWECNDNSSNILFDVYFNKSKTIVESLKNPYKKDISIKSFIIPEILKDGEIYYWTVIPKNITGKKGINVNGTWSFKINLNITPPSEVPIITLIYPANNSEVTTLKPTFKWSLNYINPTGLLFDIQLGKSSNDLNQKIRDLSVKEYLWAVPLLNLTTYYWQISVHGGDLTQTHYSKIWKFTTKVEPLENFYNFRLESIDTSLEIYQGEEKGITINIKNLLGTQGIVTLSIQSSATLEASYFRFTPQSVDLKGYKTESVILTISIPATVLKGDYQFTVIGTMETDREDLVKTLDFQLEVKTQDEKPHNGDEDGEPEDYTMYIAAGIIIIVIVVILALVLFMRKKKAKPEEYPEVEGPVEPGLPPMEGAPGEPGMPGYEMPISPDQEPLPMEEAVYAEGGYVEPTAPIGEPYPGQEPGVDTGEVAPYGEPMPEEGMPIAEGEPEGAVPTGEEVGPAGVPETGTEPEPGMPSDLPTDAYQEPVPPGPAPAPAAPPAPTAPATAVKAQPTADQTQPQTKEQKTAEE